MRKIFYLFGMHFNIVYNFIYTWKICTLKNLRVREYYLSEETMRFSTYTKQTLSIFQIERATLS